MGNFLDNKEMNRWQVFLNEIGILIEEILVEKESAEIFFCFLHIKSRRTYTRVKDN